MINTHKLELPLALWLTLVSLNYPCLEHIFKVPKVFEPLKFYCSVDPVNTTPQQNARAQLFKALLA